MRFISLFLGLLLFITLTVHTTAAANTNQGNSNPVTIANAETHPNLLPNFGFMDLDRHGVPNGWTWQLRNTVSSITPVDTRSEFGMRSLRIKNATPFGANVYGTMWTTNPIHLTPGTPYTMSCWVSISQSTVAWIGGGDDWRVRLYFPNTYGKWKQFSLTFTPSPSEAEFTFRINTDGQTNGFLLRDPKIEEGNVVTPDPPATQIDHPLFLPTPMPAINTDNPWTFQAYLYSSKPMKNAILTAMLKYDGKVVQQKSKVNAPLGLSLVTIKEDAVRVPHASANMRISINNSEGADRATSNTVIELFSANATRQALLSIQNAVPSLTKMMHKAEGMKLDVSYPRVAVTILQHLTGYALAMLDHNQIQRATSMLDQLTPMERKTKRTFQLMLARKLRYPPTPYYVTGKISIKKATFYASTKVPEERGVSVRPVNFTGWGAFDQVRKDLNILPDYGANIIQVEIGPSAVFPSEGVVSDSAVQDMIRLLKQAAKANVAVNILISPHYMPEWVMKKYPDMNVQKEGFLQYSLFAPEGREILRKFLQYVIPQLKGYPALHSFCLSNEPTNAQSPNDPNERRDWQEWLQKHYSSIGELNQLWGTNYTDFDAIPVQNTLNPPPPSPIWYDFVRFNQEFFAGWHRFLADMIHASAPNVPVHAKAMTWTMLGAPEVRYGVNAQLFGDFSQINGNDSADFYNNGVGEWADGWTLNNMAYDLQHSVLDAPIFNSENHVMPDRGEYPVPPQHLITDLWQSAIHGEGATTLWCWEETFDPKADFWGLEMERPACVQAIGDTGLDLMRLAPQVAKFQNMKPQVQILFTTAARVWDGNDFSDCLNKVYTALDFTGMKIGYVTERDLVEGKTPIAPLLIVPDIRHISNAALQTLDKYKGHILAFGGKDIFGYDDYNHPREVPAYHTIAFTREQTTDIDIWKRLIPYLTSEKLNPTIKITDINGKSQWGVEWLTVKYHGSILVNAVNYLQNPVTIKVWSGKKSLFCRNILPTTPTGYVKTIHLNPMQPVLLELKN